MKNLDWDELFVVLFVGALVAVLLGGLSWFAWREYKHPCIRTQDFQETCHRGGNCTMYMKTSGGGGIQFHPTGTNICVHRTPVEEYPCTITRCVERKP
jgi:hypothetical protein